MYYSKNLLLLPDTKISLPIHDMMFNIMEENYFSGDNGRGGYSLDSISILLSVFSHLAMCLIFTLILLSLSQTSVNVNPTPSVLVTVSQSLYTEEETTFGFKTYQSCNED